MPHLFSDIPDKLRVILSQAANIFLAVVLIYIIQYIFNSEFSCSCTIGFHSIGYIYIFVIPMIFFFILKIVRQTTTKVCAVSCGGLCPQCFQLFGICLFWWGFVLLDGDLYVCIATKFNVSLVEIPCKKEHTFQESSMITRYKNTSQTIGYILIAIGFFGWCLMSNRKIGICCDNCCPNCKNCCKREPYYKRLYEELLSEETDEYLDTNLREIAKMKAKSVCSKYMDSIKTSQISQDNEDNEQTLNTSQPSHPSVNVEDAWSTISQADLINVHLSTSVHRPPEEQESNSPVTPTVERTEGLAIQGAGARVHPMHNTAPEHS
ncbi:uncharacterized protein LOC113053756 [Carassius auratus]|uniref:Uncharacterized protein LOC113053756 n=1 Tax=Carassius auratus TaxID=7957 RepID=A0A6P6KR92_CARAU|nr:uncharacterized protein LOC113053756 [Carassius auratus]